MIIFRKTRKAKPKMQKNSLKKEKSAFLPIDVFQAACVKKSA